MLRRARKERLVWDTAHLRCLRRRKEFRRRKDFGASPSGPWGPFPADSFCFLQENRLLTWTKGKDWGFDNRKPSVPFAELTIARTL